ncbi:hypothetical protein M427DRAFT_56846 [Gonapodya prolifera JEL478]|uniref:Uncharacterized protein n=1 Tax=Gonapodya prolifera (strain JEL478) TaxID=1344416 RepID=A0A139AEN1_GONPJ|nr:hypothetical protein M427DRAFT_56846 [Gonapodya prolifera JEL478]|eukprot:KXS15218.1 hypothetical protein M427DRAFT_56846 [Gonapodya prolifera JEL478]
MLGEKVFAKKNDLGPCMTARMVSCFLEVAPGRERPEKEDFTFFWPELLVSCVESIGARSQSQCPFPVDRLTSPVGSINRCPTNRQRRHAVDKLNHEGGDSNRFNLPLLVRRIREWNNLDCHAGVSGVDTHVSKGKSEACQGGEKKENGASWDQDARQRYEFLLHDNVSHNKDIQCSAEGRHPRESHHCSENGSRCFGCVHGHHSHEAEDCKVAIQKRRAEEGGEVYNDLHRKIPLRLPVSPQRRYSLVIIHQALNSFHEGLEAIVDSEPALSVAGLTGELDTLPALQRGKRHRPSGARLAIACS